MSLSEIQHPEEHRCCSNDLSVNAHSNTFHRSHGRTQPDEMNGCRPGGTSAQWNSTRP